MKINKLNINSYGNITDKEVTLKDGINIIHGENESGKSTVLNFITNILYGVSKTKEGKTLSDYERYKPWNSSEFSGKIDYTLDNGKKFEVFRDFNKKNPKVFNENMEEISSNYNVDKKEGNNFFKEQTNIDKTMYLSTVVSMQQEVRLDSKTQNILVQKIANIAGTGEDNVSYKKALDKLQEKIKNEIGTNKTSQKPINIVKNLLEQTEKKFDEIKPFEDKKYELDEQKEKLNMEIGILEKKKAIVLSVKKNIEKSEIEKQRININEKNYKSNLRKITELKFNENEQIKKVNIVENELKQEQQKKNEIEECIENTKKEKEVLISEQSDNKEYSVKNEGDIEEEGKERLWIYSIIITITLAILILQVFFVKNIVGISTNSIILIFAYIIEKKNKQEIIKKVEQDTVDKNRKKTEEVKNKIAEYNIKIQDAEEKLKNVQEKINSILKEKDICSSHLSMIKGQINLLKKNNESIKQDNSEIELDIKEKLNNETMSINLEDDTAITKDEIMKLLEDGKVDVEKANIENKLNEMKIELKRVEIEEKNVLPQLDRLVILEEEKETLKEQYIQLKLHEKIINITIETLKEAYEEMKNNITPKFTQNLSNTVSKITSERYKRVTINDEKGLIIECDNGDYIEADRLSTGTIDQLYLSLRLSMIKELSEENLPILLDETFAYFDNERMKNILRYLVSEFKDNQVIIFTCTNREYELLKNLNIETNYIQL